LFGEERETLSRVLRVQESLEANAVYDGVQFSEWILLELANNPELDKEGLIKDRKVKEGGGDTRTYKVSFEKIKNTFPEFHCEWNVKRGVEDMVAQLANLPLSNKKFKSRGFYHLQQLEYLHENGYLSDDLFWLKSQVAI
jgi:hypothetical protein